MTGLIGVLLLGAMAPAQQDREQQPAGTQSATQEYDALSQEYTQAYRGHYQKYQEELEKAKAAGASTMPSFGRAALAAEWVPRFQTGAAKYKGQDGAMPFLLWIAANGKAADQGGAIATLLADHVASPQFGETVAAIQRMSRQVGEERARKVAAEVLARNQARNVQAQAYLLLATVTFDVSRTAFAGESPGTAEQRRKTAIESAVSDLTKGVTKADDGGLKARMEGLLFELQRLQPGMTVPEIEGNDLDGKAFKLSDYRSKVVLLDFWGDW